ncbi:MAG: polysaccharide deacetylase family protein [Peptococcaceae bacterium]|nr:polysaccharide deacetylase family protein [Peptococcaceae bacterium]
MLTTCAIAGAMVSTIFLMYALLPTFYHKYWNKKNIHTLPDKKQILLSFDDGPDPRYTGKLLDLLQKHGAKATFFVVATKAMQYPQLIERMQAEGHTVALHSCEHKNPWYKNYRATQEDFAFSLALMKTYGWQVQYYRPPWGRSNLFTESIARQHDLQMVFWNVDAKDWSEKATVHSIANQLLRKTKNGGIICLHDSGEDNGGAKDAPLKTIAALAEILPIWKQEHYEFVKPESVV